MTSHNFAAMLCGMKTNYQRPEGALISHAQKLKGWSSRQAAVAAGLSDARWRQIVNGYASAGQGQQVEVVGPDDTLARMARVVGVTPDQLRGAGRPGAADLLLTLAGIQAESEWHAVGSALDRLMTIREQLDGVIAELRDAPERGGGAPGTAPSVDSRNRESA